MEGYIKLHRQLLESTQFCDPTTLKIWIWCLLKANHKNKSVPLKNGKGYVTVSVKRGQFIFGRNKAAAELGIAGSTVLRHLERMKSEDAINIQSNNQYSVITICKYDEYQIKEEESEQPTDNQRTTNGQPTDTNNNDNNDNNVKKKKKEFSVASLSVQQSAEVYGIVKSHFFEMYASQYETEYYFSGVDGTKIQSIIKKVYFKMKEKNPDMEISVENLSSASNVFLNATVLVSDQWLKENFSLKNIDSKFNDIYSQILLARKNGQISKTSKPISKYAPSR